MVLGEILFWFSLIALVYTYVGYPLLLLVLSSFYKKSPQSTDKDEKLPKISHIIAAYNEEKVILEKIKNSLILDYPKELIEHIIVTDGSVDSTASMVEQYSGVTLLHQTQKEGKINALKRGVSHAGAPILVMSDANAMLNDQAMKNLVRHFLDPKVGVVAGEKKVISHREDDATGSGESTYWVYESFIKGKESIISSTVGAVGELYAIRAELVKFPQEDYYPDDLMLSLNALSEGYKISYCADAYAEEEASISLSDEMKRKVRISAQSIRAIPRLFQYLNPLKYGWVSWFLFSHKMLRWLVAPMALVLVLVLGTMLRGTNWFFEIFMYLQFGFYLLVFLGFCLSDKSLKIKGLFVPFYFVFAHLCTLLGYFKAFNRNTLTSWERSARKKK